MSGSQKALKVIAIIIIVVAVLQVIGGGITAAGGFLLNDSAYESISASSQGIDTSGFGDPNMSLAEAGFITMAVGVGAILMGIVNFIIGLLGLRGAKNPAKVGPFFVIAVIGAVLGIISIIWTFMYSSVAPATVLNLALVVVCVILARNIKKEASSSI